MPNFLALEMPPRPREEGINPITIPVGSLTKEEAEEYAEFMKQEFIKHWETKTKKI